MIMVVIGPEKPVAQSHCPVVSFEMKFFPLLMALLLGACSYHEENVVTLYKKGLDKTERIHVASFDTAGGLEANHTSCAAISIILETQDPMNRFWCEKGRYQSKKREFRDE